MSKILDTDLFLVNRGGIDYKVTAMEVAGITVYIGETPPLNPQEGDLWWDSSKTEGVPYIYFVDDTSSQWVPFVPAQLTNVNISDTPPPSGVSGDLWWDSESGQGFIYYVDTTSSQWVAFTPLDQGPSDIDGGTYA